MNSVYLAGFDVFLPNAKQRGEDLKAACREFGFTGLFPMDNEAPTGIHGKALARWIFDANIALIRQSRYVMANVNNFRGQEPDSGTSFEIGYAAALGIPVWAYLADGRPLVDQIHCQPTADGKRVADADGFSVENFDLPRNLMLACSSTLVIGNERDCLARMAAARDQSIDERNRS